MGTRSTIRFTDERNTNYITIYQQYDGYIDGVGHELAEFLNRITIVNGFNSEMSAGTHANGIGCLIAQFIAEKKTGIGNLYVDPIDSFGSEDYNYLVVVKDDGSIEITVDNWGESPFFKGTPEQLLNVYDCDFEED